MSLVLAHRYILRRRIGRGGMGEVHEALSIGAGGFERRVAIKRLLAEGAANPSCVRMFVDEARIASKLHHGGIVSILDYGVVDGVPFQVFELVDGMSAEAACALGRETESPMPLEVALFITTEAAHALHHAHTAEDDRGRPLGIVHRDVKPSNILLSRSGDVKVGDFGIALAHERLSKTTTSTVKGTPGYMAPEQLLGGHVGPRADIFALGCVLHKLATGASPVVSREDERRMLAGGGLRLAEDLPEDVVAIVKRAVAREPRDRFATAGEMASVLGEVLARRLQRDAKGLVIAWLGALVDAAVPSDASVATRTETLSGSHVSAPNDHVSVPNDHVSTPNEPVIELFLEGLAGDTRSFSSRPTATVDGTKTPPPNMSPRRAEAPSPRAPSRLRVFALAALTTVALAGGAIFAARRHLVRTPPPLPTTVSADAAVVADVDVSAAVEVDAAAADDATDAAFTDALASPAPTRHASQGGRCFCREKRQDRFHSQLCVEPLTPRCTCQTGPWSRLCPTPWRSVPAFPDRMECPGTGSSFTFGGPGKVSGQPCTGYEFSRVSPTTSQRVTGKLSCEVCYGTPSGRFAAIQGTPCRGVTEDGTLRNGEWECP